MKSIVPLRKKMLFIVILLLPVGLVFLFFGDVVQNKYPYRLKLALVGGFPAYLDQWNTVLYDRRGNKIDVELVGGDPGNNIWANGEYMMGSGGYYPLPKTMKIRWYSALEKTTWEGTVSFNEEQLDKLVNLSWYDTYYQEQMNNSENIDITINLFPTGYGIVWLEFMGMRKQVASFQASSVPVPWGTDIKIISFDAYDYDSAEAYAESQLQYASDEIKQEIKATGKMRSRTQELQERLMTYNWHLSVNQPFTLVSYKAFYTNGDYFYIYADRKDDVLKAKPGFFNIYMQDSDKKPYAVSVNLLAIEDEVKDVFKRLSGPLGVAPMELKLNFDPKNMQASLTLVSQYGEHEFKGGRFALVDAHFKR